MGSPLLRPLEPFLFQGTRHIEDKNLSTCCRPPRTIIVYTWKERGYTVALAFVSFTRSHLSSSTGWKPDDIIACALLSSALAPEAPACLSAARVQLANHDSAPLSCCASCAIELGSLRTCEVWVPRRWSVS